MLFTVASAASVIVKADAALSQCEDESWSVLHSPRIFLAVKSDLIGEKGDRSHPKTAQVWNIYAWDRIPRNYCREGTR